MHEIEQGIHGFHVKRRKGKKRDKEKKEQIYFKKEAEADNSE
jgi:hypothetical protein